MDVVAKGLDLQSNKSQYNIDFGLDVNFRLERKVVQSGKLILTDTIKFKN